MTKFRQYAQKLHEQIGVEPAMVMFMFAFSIKASVFQQLLYDKVCWQRYPGQSGYCANLTAVHDNPLLQADQTRLYWISSVCNLVPSIFVTLILGSLSDTWNTKIPLLIPFFGLILGDFNYILQAYFLHANPYFLVISDLVFGFSGGLSSVFGLLFAYGMKQTVVNKRAIRSAVLENCTSIGTALGAAVSGMLRGTMGYSNVFVFLLTIHVFTVFYLVMFTKNYVAHHSKSQPIVPAVTIVGNKMTAKLACGYHQPSKNSRISIDFRSIIVNFWSVIGRSRTGGKRRVCIWILLTAIMIDSLAEFGINDVAFSFLRYQLAWTDLQYGWWRGIQQLAGIVGLAFIFPLLQFLSAGNNFTSTIIGLIGNIISFSAMAMVTSKAWALAVSSSFVFFDIPITGLRALASGSVDDDEQGILCSTIALMISLAAALSSTLIDGVLYPCSLTVYPGLSFLVCAGLLILVMGLLCIFRRCNKAFDSSVEKTPHGDLVKI